MDNSSKYKINAHAANKGLLSAGLRGFSQVSFFYLTLVYSDRKRLRFTPPNSKPGTVTANCKKKETDNNRKEISGQLRKKTDSYGL
jgi:hypothetical protein